MVAGHQLAIVNTVVSSRVLVTDTNHHQALVAGDDVFLWCERHSVSSLGLAVVVPLCHAAILSHISLSHRTGKMDALSKVGQELSLEQGAVTQASLGTCWVVKKSGVI